MTVSGSFRKRTTTELLHDQDPEVRRHIAARATGVAEAVALPPLPAGQYMFPHVATPHEEPPELHWDSVSYRSVTPWLLTFEDVLVRGDAGIVCAGDWVVSDMLLQTGPEFQFYSDEGDRIRFPIPDDVPVLAGSWLSLLGGNYVNYYHWTIDGLGRMAAVDASVLAEVPSVLVPAFTDAVRRDGFALTGLAEGRTVRCLAPGDTVRVERLIVPWTLLGYHYPHPLLRPYFHKLRDACGPARSGFPRRIYIDRRANDRRPSASRCLLNEDEVITALGRLGFEPVLIERLSLAEQIGLFASAEAIVGSHGAGLTNIVYAGAGCRVVELHMDSSVVWCFRALAAVFGLTYDAVVGREIVAASRQGPTKFWAISVTHLVAAVEAALRLPADRHQG